MLQGQHPYVGLGVEYFHQRHHERVTRQAVTRLEALGHEAALNPAS